MGCLGFIAGFFIGADLIFFVWWWTDSAFDGDFLNLH